MIKKLLLLTLVLGVSIMLAKGIVSNSEKIATEMFMPVEEEITTSSAPVEFTGLTSLNEGFEEWEYAVRLPFFWRSFHYDVDVPWLASRWTTSTTYPLTGTRCAHLAYNGGGTEANNDWLITRMVYPTINDTLFSFWWRGDGTFAESMEVWVSTTTQDPAGMATMLWAGSILSATYTLVEVNLTAYLNTPIFVGMHNTALADMNYTKVDDVLGPAYPATDVGVWAITSPAATFVLGPGSVTPAATVVNMGSTAPADFAVVCTVYDATGAPVYNDVQTVTGATLLPGTSAPVTFLATPSLAIGTYSMMVASTLVGDAWAAHNVKTRTFAVNIGPEVFYDNPTQFKQAGLWSGPGAGYGIKVTPSVYPTAVWGVAVVPSEPTYMPENENYPCVFGVRVYGDNGSGAPGALLYEQRNIPGLRWQWNYVEVPRIPIVSGSYFVYWVQEDLYPFSSGIAGDSAGVPAGVQYSYNNVSHSVATATYAFHIRAVEGAPIYNDVGVSGIDFLRPAFSGDVKTIIVNIKNLGVSPQTGFTVSYDPGDGSPVVTEGPVAFTVPAAGETIYTFTAPWTAGAINPALDFKAWTTLAGDERPENDTLAIVAAVCPLTQALPYSEDFDGAWGPLGNNPPLCGWKIQDALHPYPVDPWNTNDFYNAGGWALVKWAPYEGALGDENQDEWLISPLFDCSGAGQYTLSYWWYYVGYSGAPVDTGYVLLSTDDGATWTELTKYIGHTDDERYGDTLFDLTTAVIGENDVRVAFRYFAYDGAYYGIDDFVMDYIPAYTLTVNIVGNGVVTPVPDTTYYLEGTVVSLTADPDPTYAFMGWTGDATGMDNPVDVTMDGNKTVTATFTLGGWYVSTPMPTTNTPKLVKDGGAIIATSDAIYGFKGWKSPAFYKFDGAVWNAMETIPWGLKWKPGATIDSAKFNKKGPGKGASLAWDGMNTIYAIKGNSTYEFWAYDMTLNTWTAKAFVGGDKGVKGGSCIAYHDGKVYLMLQKQKLTGNFFVYDVATDVWTALTAPGEGPNVKKWKDGTDLIAFGTDKLVAIKGGDKYCPFWQYDIPGDTLLGAPWTELESIPLVHPTLAKKIKIADGGSITTDGSVVYAIKGGGKQDFWMYTPGTPGVWTPMEVVPQGPLLKKGCPKTGAGLAYLNGYVYLLKGNKTDEFWNYIPGSPTLRVNPTTITTTTGNATPLNFNLVASFGRTVNYTVPTAAKVSMKLYNASGRLVETVHDGYLNAGNYTTTVNVNSGVYFLKYNDGTNSAEVKLIVQ